MKSSTSVNLHAGTSSMTGSRVFDTQPLSRIGALERKNRILSVACYFGMAPFLWFSGVIRQQNRLLNHHLLYSLAFSFTVLCAVAFDLITDRIQAWITLYLWHPTMAEFDSQVLLYAIFSLFCMVATSLIVLWWGVAWLKSLAGAWRGQTPHIPVIAGVAGNFQAIRLAVHWSLLIEITMLIVLGLGIRSAQLAQRMTSKADVYVLYTVGGYIPAPGLSESFTPPRWAVTMAFYPLVHAAIERFGDDGFSALPLTEENFDVAIHNGRFIFVASHGGSTPGAFSSYGFSNGDYSPADVDQSVVGDQLQYAYFAGCWTGALEPEWRQVLGLEDATMFDRLSFVDEHMLWAWFKSPAVISGLDK